FGHRVGQVGAGPLRIQVQRRRQGQDVGVVRAAQGVQAQLGEQEGAADVDVVHQVVAFHRHGVRAGEVDGGGVVHHDVDAAEFGHGGLDGALDVLVVAHVPDDRQCARPVGADLLGCGVDGPLEVGVGGGGLGQQGDVGASCSQLQGDRQPD